MVIPGRGWMPPLHPRHRSIPSAGPSRTGRADSCVLAARSASRTGPASFRGRGVSDPRGPGPAKAVTIIAGFRIAGTMGRSPAHRFLILAVAILAPASLSGCVGEEFFPEPFAWVPVGEVEGAFQSPESVERHPFTLHGRVDRLRVVLDVALATDAIVDPLRGTQAFGLNVTLRFKDGSTHAYVAETSRTFTDELPAVAGGTLEVVVVGRGQGSWTLRLDEHRPVHEDYAWYDPSTWS